MMKNFRLWVICILILTGKQASAQSQHILSSPVIGQTASEEPADTISTRTLEEEDLQRIPDLRAQFEKQNSAYAAPVRPDASLLRFLKKDEMEISDEAKYWARLVRDASTTFDSYVTFEDTVIVNPLFMPIVFKGDYLPDDLTFYNFDVFKPKSPYDGLYKADSLFPRQKRQQELEEMAYKYVQNNHPTYFRYSENDLPQDVIKPKAIHKNIYEDLPIEVTADADFSDVTGPAKFIPERRYWTSGFESTIQFAQNYISKNWNNGGNSNLNMTTRQYLKYDYNKDKVRFVNELEIKLNMNTLPSSIDTVHPYKVNDDVLRIHSSFGYEAFSKWYYTLDFNFKTQMINNYAQNSETILAAFLAPMAINIGPGMKYELEKKDFKDKHKNLKFSINLQPISYDFMYSVRKGKDMDLSRHGFKEKENPVEGQNPYKNVLSQIGSRIDANLVFNFNRNISWSSRFVYFTTYEKINGEFENTLNLQINRFFSTRINLQVRYDDGVVKGEDFKSYFQVNELLSFGFNYKW